MRAGCDLSLLLELSRFTVVFEGVGNTCFVTDTSPVDDDDNDDDGNDELSLPSPSCCSKVCSKVGRSSCLHLTTDNV